MKPEKFRALIREAAFDAGATDDQAEVMADTAGAIVDRCCYRIKMLEETLRLPMVRDQKTHAIGADLVSGSEGKFRQIAGHAQSILAIADDLPLSALEILLRRLFEREIEQLGLDGPAVEYNKTLPQALTAGEHLDAIEARGDAVRAAVCQAKAAAYREKLQQMLEPFARWGEERCIRFSALNLKSGSRAWRRTMICDLATLWSDTIGAQPEARGPFLEAATVALEASGAKLKRSAACALIRAALAGLADP